MAGRTVLFSCDSESYFDGSPQAWYSQQNRVHMIQCIILLNGNPTYVRAIYDGIELLKLSDEIVFAENALVALATLPEASPYIVVMDSTIYHPNAGEEKTEAALLFIAEAKKKNPSGKIILYADDIFPITSPLLDLYINSAQRGSYERLIEKLQEYTVSVSVMV
jgi:hypothetical protein